MQPDPAEQRLLTEGKTLSPTATSREWKARIVTYFFTGGLLALAFLYMVLGHMYYPSRNNNDHGSTLLTIQFRENVTFTMNLALGLLIMSWLVIGMVLLMAALYFYLSYKDKNSDVSKAIWQFEMVLLPTIAIALYCALTFQWFVQHKTAVVSGFGVITQTAVAAIAYVLFYVVVQQKSQYNRIDGPGLIVYLMGSSVIGLVLVIMIYNIVSPLNERTQLRGPTLSKGDLAWALTGGWLNIAVIVARWILITLYLWVMGKDTRRNEPWGWTVAAVASVLSFVEFLAVPGAYWLALPTGSMV